MKICCILFVMSLWLVGCASYVNVSVSDGGGDYSIYRNGELVCSSSDACTVESTAESGMYLEAKKDGVVYGSAYAHRVKKEIDHSRDDEYDWSRRKTRKQIREETEQNERSLSLIFAFVFPFFLVCVDFGKFPDEVVIPVETPDSAIADFPWDQPIKKD